MKTKTKPSKKQFSYIQLRTKESGKYAVHFCNKEFVSKEQMLTADYEVYNPSTTYLDASRARELGFALLSAANKLERTERNKSTAMVKA